MPDKEPDFIQSPTLVNLKQNDIKDVTETKTHRKAADDLLNRPKILMYHRIVDDEALSQTQETCVHISEFRKQLKLIDRLGYTPITFDDYRLFQAGEIQLPRKPLILTFDDGYLDTYRFAFPLLREFGMKGVVFILGDQSIRTNVWDAGQPGISEARLMDKNHIIELSSNGFEIGGHSLSHPNLVNLSEAECLHEVKKTKIVLEAITGAEVLSFSYPYGQVSRPAKDCVVESGYRYACSVFSGPARFESDLFEIRRITIRNTTTIPGLALRLVSPYEYLEWMWWKSRSSGIYYKNTNPVLIAFSSNDGESIFRGRARAMENELFILNSKEKKIRGWIMLSIVEDMLSMGINRATVAGSVDKAVMAMRKPEPGEPEKIDGDLHSTVKISIVENEQTFDELEEEWNQLLKKSEVHIYQSFEWQRAWWEYFGNSGRLHILTFRSRGQLVGIAPFFFSETRLPGLYTYRHLQFLASHIPAGDSSGTFFKYSISDYLDLIVDPEYQEKVAEALMNYLAEQKNFFDQISLDELPEKGAMMQSFIPRLKENDWPYVKEKTEICPQIELPASIDEYLYRLKSSVRYKLRRSKRPVTDDNLYEVRTTQTEQELESVFSHLVDLHQERWNKQGYPGVFADKRVEKFLKEVSGAFLRRDWLKMKSAFDHDGNCLAVDLTFSFKERIYDYQRAFDITSDLARHRPGFALTYFLIEEAIDEEKEVYDLLRGDERYKLRMTTSTPQNWKVTIHNLAREKGLKHRLSQLVSGVSNLRFRIKREFMLLHIHIREWGVGFVPAYTDFVKERLKENANG